MQQQWSWAKLCAPASTEESDKSDVIGFDIDEEVEVTPKKKYKKNSAELQSQSGPVHAETDKCDPSDWGLDKLHQRVNVGQVSFNFDLSVRRSCSPVHQRLAYLVAPSVSDKHFGTLQICVHPGLSVSYIPNF